MKTVLKVTQEDIRRGKRKDFNWCPIARAAKRVVRGEYRGKLMVDTEGLSFGQGDYCAVHKGNVEEFVNEFDEGEKVRPQVFILDIPEEYLNPRVFKQVRT